MKFSQQITAISAVFMCGCAFAGGLSVEKSGVPQANLSVISQPVQHKMKGTIPVIISVQKFAVPTKGKLQGSELTYKIFQGLKGALVKQDQHGVNYYAVLSRFINLKHLLKNIGREFDYEQYRYAGLNGYSVNLNRYSHLGYTQKKDLPNLKITNDGNIYFGYGFTIKPKIKQSQLDITTYYDSILPKKDDPLGLPEYKKHSFSSVLNMKRGESLLVMWQNTSVDFAYHNKTQILYPVHVLNAALITYNYYPGYFKEADKKAAHMRSVLND